MSLGSAMQCDAQGLPVLAELKEMRNVAAVIVTAKVPGIVRTTRRSTRLLVGAARAKSLQGGRLVLAHLYGPHRMIDRYMP